MDKSSWAEYFDKAYLETQSGVAGEIAPLDFDLACKRLGTYFIRIIQGGEIYPGKSDMKANWLYVLNKDDKNGRPDKKMV